jgi:hypothetical protein
MVGQSRVASSRLVASYSARSAAFLAQVVAEDEMPTDFGRALGEHVDVHIACRRPQHPMLVPVRLANPQFEAFCL